MVGTKKKQVQCKDVGCDLPGCWYETLSNGDRAICFRAKHNGDWHVVRKRLPKGVKELPSIK